MGRVVGALGGVDQLGAVDWWGGVGDFGSGQTVSMGRVIGATTDVVMALAGSCSVLHWSAGLLGM